MSLSKPLFFHLKTLTPLSLRRLPSSSTTARLLSFATPEDAAAERRRRKRQLRIQPPLSSQHRQQPQQQRLPHTRSPSSNPNAPKLPEPATALAGNRLTLHTNILNLIRANDLDEASLLVRHSIYSNCRPTVFTCNAVLNALLRQCRYSDLLSLHRFITQASVAPSLITHNLIIQAYVDCRKTDTALEHYRLISKDDAPLAPSPTTYRILAKGLVDNSKLDQAIELKDDMLAKGFFAPDPAFYNTLMSGFLKADDPGRVLSLYEELKEKLGGGRILDGAIYGNLMKGYFGKGMEKEAMEVYDEVLGAESKVRFGAVSYNSVLDALSKNGRLEEAVGLFERMVREHNPPRKITVNLGSFNVMVDGFCVAGRFDDAIAVFNRMGKQKCVPDAVSYNNLIRQLGENRLVAEAEVLYTKMKEAGVSADEYTHALLVESCFRVGRDDDAVGYFRKMGELGLRPNASSYNKVVGGLVNVGRIDEGKGFFDAMVEKGVKPNAKSFELLIEALLGAGRLDEGLEMVRGMLMEEGLSLSQEIRELVEGALRKEEREGELEKLIEDVEREKAEALAQAAEEKARAEAAAKEEEERKKAEDAAKEAADAKAKSEAIEKVLGRFKSSENTEKSTEVSLVDDATNADGGMPKEVNVLSSSGEEAKDGTEEAVEIHSIGLEEETKGETGDAAPEGDKM